MHVSIFKGLSNVQDEQDMQGPYERKNQTIEQGTILELNVIGRKDYDNVKLFQSVYLSQLLKYPDYVDLFAQLFSS